MEQRRNAVVAQVILLALPKTRPWPNTHLRGLAIRAPKLGIANPGEERLFRPIEGRDIPFYAAPTARILPDISNPSDTLRNNARLRALEKMPQVKNVELPITAEDFISSLPIE
jgi:hypothetical protein